jgi:hypothetical protein
MNRAGNFNLIDSRLNAVALRSHAEFDADQRELNDCDEGLLINMM